MHIHKVKETPGRQTHIHKTSASMHTIFKAVKTNKEDSLEQSWRKMMCKVETQRQMADFPSESIDVKRQLKLLTIKTNTAKWSFKSNNECG